jgi:hypothetical protein
MSDLQTDTLLFLRLAGSRSGVQWRYIPDPVIHVVENLGGRIRFKADRVFIHDARVIRDRAREVWGRTDPR